MAGGSNADAKTDQEAKDQREKVSEWIGERRPDEPRKRIWTEAKQYAKNAERKVRALEGAFRSAVFCETVLLEFIQREFLHSA
jgi:hypothetical protein